MYWSSFSVWIQTKLMWNTQTQNYWEYLPSNLGRMDMCNNTPCTLSFLIFKYEKQDVSTHCQLESGLKHIDTISWTTFTCSEWEKQHLAHPKSLKHCLKKKNNNNNHHNFFYIQTPAENLELMHWESLHLRQQGSFSTKHLLVKHRKPKPHLFTRNVFASSYLVHLVLWKIPNICKTIFLLQHDSWTYTQQQQCILTLSSVILYSSGAVFHIDP